jgi:Serine carboxypeptidase
MTEAPSLIEPVYIPALDGKVESLLRGALSSRLHSRLSLSFTEWPDVWFWVLLWCSYLSSLRKEARPVLSLMTTPTSLPLPTVPLGRTVRDKGAFLRARALINDRLSDFKVNTPLPGVNFGLKQSYAGNLPVNRPDHPNDTLFFWGFEKSTGSLTSNSPSNRAPWTIWLNGGPGSSSFYGFFFEVSHPLVVASS